MLLPELFEFLLSTARAGCGMGIVLTGFWVGKWAYSNPQPTWPDTWRKMPPVLRWAATGLAGVFLISHVILTVREFSDGAPAPVAAPVQRFVPEPKEDQQSPSLANEL
jgi:hypothetical protein